MRRNRPVVTSLVLLVAASVVSACDEDAVHPDPAVAVEAPSGQLAALSAPAALGPEYRFHGRAQFADASFYAFTGDADVFGFVSAFRTDPNPGSTEVVLSYSLVRCDFEGCVELEAGFGTIPSADFKASSGSAVLDTNTSFDSNPGFFRWAGDGGPIRLEWTGTSMFSTHMVSSENSTFGSIRYHRTANGTYSSAGVSGSLIGYDVGAFGSIGTSLTTEIAISIAQVVAAASGSGHLTVDGENRTFAFHAVQLSDGRTGGEWQRYNRASDARAHGKVTCMTIVGNQAWLGGFATLSTTGAGNVIWRVEDARPGAAAPDRISLQLTGVADWTRDEHCYGTPATPPLLPIESGNIRIRP